MLDVGKSWETGEKTWDNCSFPPELPHIFPCFSHDFPTMRPPCHANGTGHAGHGGYGHPSLGLLGRFAGERRTVGAQFLQELVGLYGI